MIISILQNCARIPALLPQSLDFDHFDLFSKLGILTQRGDSITVLQEGFYIWLIRVVERAAI